MNFIQQFFHHHDAHIFQHGHHRREDQRLVGAVDLKAQLVRASLNRVIQVHLVAVIGQRLFHIFYVIAGCLNIEHFGIGMREGFAITMEQTHTTLFTQIFDQGLLQAIFPGAGHIGQMFFQFLAVDIRYVAGLRFDDKLHTGKRFIGHERIMRGDMALEFLTQLPADQLAQG